MLRAFLILSLLWSSCCDVLAQNSFTVRGVVRDTAGEALSKATILLVNNKDSLITLSHEDGSFIFLNQESMQIGLTVSMKGYVTIHRTLSMKQRLPYLDVDPILLSVDYTQLDSVVVKRARPIIIGFDTISYNAAAFKVRDGSEVEVLLKRLPGIEVDMSGNVFVKGKKVAHVRVDGKDFFGGDVLTATRNLPADIIEKIQVLDDYGDKAHLIGIKIGEPVKILNLVLKPDKRTGQFGDIQAAVGSKNKYAGDAFVNLFKGERQFSITGSQENLSPAGKTNARTMLAHYANRWDKKWLGEANINISNDNRSVTGFSIQENYYPNGRLHQELYNNPITNDNKFNFGSTIIYTPDAIHTLRISPSLNMESSRQILSSQLSTVQTDSAFAKTTTANSLNRNDNNMFDVRSDIYYEQLSTHSKRRLSAQLNFQYSGGQSQNDNISNIVTKCTQAISLSDLHFLINTNSNNWGTKAGVNYFSPVGKRGFLELGYSWNSSLSRNNKQTKGPNNVNGHFENIDSLSNDYFFQNIIHKLHTGYSAKLERFSMSLSLDVQPGSIRGTVGNKNNVTSWYYLSILPGMQANWALAPGKAFSLQYSASPDLPSLQILQPITDRSNPQYPVTGNPSLKPAFSQSVDIHYEQSQFKHGHFQGFDVSIGTNISQHTIIPSAIHPKDTGSVIQEITYINAGASSSHHVEYHINLPPLLSNRCQVTYSGNFAFSQIDAMADFILYTTRTFGWSQDMHFQYILADIFESEVVWNYSLTRIRQRSKDILATDLPSSDWSINNRHILWHTWVVNYNLTQIFNSGANGGLQAQPVYLSASIQRRLFSKNRATLSLTGNDLLNNSKGITQLITATSVTRSQTDLIGRYLTVRLLWKWGKFRE